MSDIDDTSAPPLSKLAPGRYTPAQPQPGSAAIKGHDASPKSPIKLTRAILKSIRVSKPTVDPALGKAWHEGAVDLASWAFKHLVNNPKGHGGYIVELDDSVSKTTCKSPPDHDRLIRHFRARSGNDLMGLHALVRGDDGICCSLWTGIDIDKHDDAEGDADANLKLALAVHDRAKAAGFEPLLSQSDGGGGYHCLILHAAPIGAKIARGLGQWLVRDWAAFGLASEPEVFPKQDEIRVNGWGSWLRLFGRHHKRPHYSRFRDGTTWLEGRDAIDFVLRTTGSPAGLIPGVVLDILADEEEAKTKPVARGTVALGLPGDGEPNGQGPTAEGQGHLRPGDDFAAKHTWADILKPHGWSIFKVQGEVTHWARPGVTDHPGATTNHDGSDRLYLFTNATNLKEQVSYTKFGAYAVLEHVEDHAAAARHLAARGYGSGGRKVGEDTNPASMISMHAGPNDVGSENPEVDAARPMETRRAPRSRPSAARPFHLVGPGDVSNPTSTGQVEHPTPMPPIAVGGNVVEPITRADPTIPSDQDLGIVAMGGLTPTAIEWLWPDRFALGKYNLLAGVGGEGKTQFATRLVAMVSRGEAFPDGSGVAPVGNCLFVSSEDGLRDTIVPRLLAADADMTRCFGLKAQLTIKVAGKEQVNQMSFQDLDYWRQVFERKKPTLIVVDPIPAYLGRGVNDHRNNEVRAVLEPFCALLDEHRVTLLAITHLGKSVDQKTPIARVLGSVAYANVARTVSVVYRDPHDADRRLLCPLKNNFSPPQESLAYRIEGREIEAEGRTIKTSRIAIEAETVDVDAAELMAAQGRPRGPSPTRYLEMATWLYDRLQSAPGPVRVGELAEGAGEAGFLGTLDNEGRWSNFRLLYRGAGRVPALPPPRDGHRVVQYVIGGRGKDQRRLLLIPIGSSPPRLPEVDPGWVTVEVLDEQGKPQQWPPPA